MHDALALARPRNPAAIINNASLPNERVIRTPLDPLPLIARALGDGPALVLIGAALRLPGQTNSAGNRVNIAKAVLQVS